METKKSRLLRERRQKAIEEAEQKQKVGRVPFWSNVIEQKVLELAEMGKTDKQIANFVGMSPDVIWDQKKKDPKFLEAYVAAKLKADELVELSLFQRATGYVKEYKREVMSASGKVSEVMEATYIQPDTKAIQFWLKNRQPVLWRQDPQNRIENVINVNEVPSPNDLLQETAKLMFQEYKRLQAKQTREGLNTDDINNLSKLTRSLMDIKDSQDQDVKRKAQIASQMPTQELLSEAKKIVAEIEVNQGEEVTGEPKLQDQKSHKR